MTIEHKLTVRTNADFDETFNWTDENGATYALAGLSAEMQIRDSETDEVIVELTTANSRLTLASADPNISMHIDKTVCELLAPTKAAEWDLVITYGDGSIEVFPLAGPAEIVKGVTRD